MIKKRILVTNILPEEGLKGLYPDFEVIAPKSAPFTRKEVLELIPECQGIIPAFFKVDKEIIDQGRNLKIISNYGAGFDNVDIAYATEKGIMVTNIPETVTQATAELALGLMISLMRRITETDRLVRKDSYEHWGTTISFLGTSLEGKILGIVGMGRIGMATARLAQAFGMQVIYQKRKPYPPEVEKTLNIRYAPLEELLKEADVVSLHCPLTPETRHLLGEKEFKLMKPTAVVVNTARGPVIHEKALIEALEKGEIKGAALDVFEFEPKVSAELLKMDNVVLTPHIGSSTLETRTIMAQACVKHIQDFFAGKRPTHIVNPEVKLNLD